MLEAKRFEKGWLASGGKATRRKLADYLCIGKQGVGVRMTGDEVEICVASMEMVRRLPTDATALTMLHTMRDKPEQIFPEDVLLEQKDEMRSLIDQLCAVVEK